MFHNFFVKVASLIVAGLIGLGLYLVPVPQVQNFGADTTLPIAGITYTLSGSGISGSATSIGLTSLTIPQTGYEIQDSDLSSTFYITLEPGSRTRQEIASCTTATQNTDNTATLSGCVRGLLPFTPYTASSSYQFAHAGGTSVVFSNPPQLYNEFTGKTNDETITGIWTWNASSLPRVSSSPTYESGDELKFVTYGQLASTSFSGTVDASLTQKGIVEMANKTEMANGSLTGGTTAPLFIPAQYFNATSSATSTVPVTGSDGILSSTFMPTSTAYNWTGQHSFASSTTFTASTTNSGTSTYNGNVIFTASTTQKLTPVGGTDVVNKNYVDSNKTSFVASTTMALATNGAGVSTTLAITLSDAGKLLIIMAPSINFDNCNGYPGTNAVYLKIDGNQPADFNMPSFSCNTPTINSTSGGVFSSTYITASLSAGSHLINASSTAPTANQSVGGGQFQVEFIGN